MWVRGLKRPVLPQYFRFRQSHPVWVRGLKQAKFFDVASGIESHPVWVRGLKPYRCIYRCALKVVAPRVGAWIETQ